MCKNRKRLCLIAVSFLHLPPDAMAEILSTQDWWGSLGLTYQRRMLDNDTTEIKSQLVGDINSKYYVWQPWFLTGKFRLTLTGDRTTDSRSERDSTAVGGTITANLLPQSRYPMSLGYSKSDNTISDSDSFVNSTGQLVNLGDTSSSISYFITQQYLGKRFKLAASYHSDENESDSHGRFSSIKRKLEFTRRDPHNDINFSIQQRELQQHREHEQRDNQTAVLTHNYYPSQDFNIASFASTIEQLDRMDLDDDGIIDNYRNAIDQFASTITWRSSDKKTHITGNLRYTGIETEQRTQYENISSNLGLAARYSFSRNLKTRASVSQAVTELNGTTSKQTDSAASLHYRSNSIDLFGAQYNWGGSLGETRQQNDNTSETTAEVSLNHNASHSWLAGRKARIRLSADQALTERRVSRQDDNLILDQGLRLGYSSSNDGGTRYAQANYSESRNISGPEEFSSQLNIQLSQQQKLSTRSSLNGSVTHQQSRFQNPTQETRSTSSSVILSYAIRHSFMFQTLSYNTSLRYSLLQSNAAEDSSSCIWDNIFKHQVGLLNSSLTLRTQKVHQQHTSLLLLNIKRHF